MSYIDCIPYLMFAEVIHLFLCIVIIVVLDKVLKFLGELKKYL